MLRNRPAAMRLTPSGRRCGYMSMPWVWQG
jgi:hypothetical protein